MNSYNLLLVWVVIILLVRHVPQIILDFINLRKQVRLSVPSSKQAFLMIVLWVVMHGFALESLSGMAQAHNWLTIIGITMVTLGCILGLVALLTLRTSYHMNLVITKEHRLVTDGIYRIVRHPMRLALAIETLGAVVISRNPFLVFVWILLVTFQILRSHREEKLLGEYYGEPVIQYQKNVPAFNPFYSIFRYLLKSPSQMNLNSKRTPRDDKFDVSRSL